MNEITDNAREHVRKLAAEHIERGDQLGWFEALYSEAEGKTEHIPWADLEPNSFFTSWAEENDLKGCGKRAIVVGCGLGDDARYLYDHGFDVTAFDISPTAIAWAKRLHRDTEIQFEVADLFQPVRSWLGAFDFVLEIYTIQPLPLDLRTRAIDAIASFVATGGKLVVVCRGREDNEPAEFPWPLSRTDLVRFETHGLRQKSFYERLDDSEDPPVRRFVVEYDRN